MLVFWILHCAFQLSETGILARAGFACHVSLSLHFISGTGPFVSTQRNKLAAMVGESFGGSRNDGVDSKLELLRSLL